MTRQTSRHALRTLLSLVTAVYLIPAAAQHAEEHDHMELVADASLTLAEVVDVAIKNQPRWLEGDARFDQAEAWSDVSRSLIAGQPVLQLDYLDDQVFDNLGEREIQAGMEFPLWWPGQKKSGAGLASAYQGEAQHWQQSFAWQVAGEVRQMLAEILLAEARLELTHTLLVDAEQLLGVTETMQQAGEVAEHDVLQAEAEVLAARAVEFEADAEAVDARRSWAIYTGLRSYPAKGLPETQAPDMDITLSHPLLAQGASSLDRARQQTEQERFGSRGSPTLTVGARRQRADSLTPDNNALALSISIPLGGKRFTSAKVADARRNETDIEVQLQQQRRALETALHEVEHAMLVNEQKLDLALENNALGERRWNMARTAWELGENAMPEVILALRQYHAAQLELATLQIQRQALVSSFNQTLGVMP